MRRLRKFGSILLVLALCLTMLPVTAGAEEPEAADGRDSRADTSWYKEGDSEFTISTAEELAELAQLVNGGKDFSGKTITLTADIDLKGTNENQWTPIGTNDTPFTGTFEGNNHTISGLHIDNSNTAGNYYGLFGYVKKGTVQNLTVSGSVTAVFAGGVVGWNDGGSVANCHNQAEVATNDQTFLDACVGGVVGWNEGGTVANCRNTGRVSHSISQSYAGGVVGKNYSRIDSAVSTVTNCRNAGPVTASKGYCGGVVGYNGSNGRVANCCNTGPVTGNGGYPGGVVGHNYIGTVASCCNTGPVTSSGSCGGVVGWNAGGTAANCYNANPVTSSGSSPYVGGVVGRNNTTGGTGAAVMNCYNTGMVTSDSSCGGVVGSNGNSSSVTHCYFLQDASHNAGLPGVGSGESASAGVTALDSTSFASGQVAWELQNWWDNHALEGEEGQVWGQNLDEDGDESPVLTGLNPGSPRAYQLTFQAEGAAEVILYGNSGSLPFPAVPTPPTGQTFTGWFSGDTRLTEATEITADIVAVARFGTTPEPEPTPPSQPSGGSDSEPSYSPILDIGDGGTVRVNPRTPSAGDDVTITAEPDQGFEVEEVTVTDRNGSEIRVTDNRDGTYRFNQPRGRVTISVTFRERSAPLPFGDVAEDYWAADAIAWAYTNGYMNGVSAGTFLPGGIISRQQIWMILARLSGENPANMAAARIWAVDHGISDGTTPGGAVTRQQLAALLYRFARLMGYDTTQGGMAIWEYADYGQISNYALEAMDWAVTAGILNGTTATTLNPQSTATRAQFAVMLYRFMN